jgi:exonuclease SbcD
MIRFLHAADFHLDSPFASLSPQQAAARRRESRELPARLVRCAADRGADLLLLSGDLFDTAAPYRETGEALCRALGETDLPVFIAPGNHDYCSPESPYARLEWPENVHIFRTGRVESVELPELGAVVHGAAFTAPEQTRSLLAGFHAPRDGRVHLMVLHGEIEPPEARYDPLTRDEIAASELAYLALGHIHQYAPPRTFGRTVAAWPGCPEGRGFDELGERGILEGCADGAGGVEVRFVPFARHHYRILTADVTGRAPEEAARAALPPESGGDLVRLLLTGETDETGVDLPALRQALEGRCYALELRDETRLQADVWARAGEDSLRGLFLRELRARLAAAGSGEERERIQRAARFGLAALDRRDLG